MGMVPVNDIGVFLDILPEILTMLLGSLMKYRANIIQFSEMNREKIEKIIVEAQFIGDVEDLERRLSSNTIISKSIADNIIMDQRLSYIGEEEKSNGQEPGLKDSILNLEDESNEMHPQRSITLNTPPTQMAQMKNKF